MPNIFIDMDDVVADFSKKIFEITGVFLTLGETYSDENWNKILQHTRIYKNLEKTEGADQIVNASIKLAKTKSYDIKFLTAVPRKNDFPWAFYDKVNWAALHYPAIPVWFGPYSKDKHIHCNAGDILIDDRLSNINDWKSVGGIAVWHKNWQQTVKEINHQCQV